MKKLVIGATLVLLLVAAGCGGGSKALTKDEYASQLSAACKESNDELNALSLADMASFKARGDEAVKIGEETVKKFKSLKAPDEVKDAARAFNDSSDQILQDLKDARDAAAKDDEAAFNAAGRSVQQHGKENDTAATEIGAAECAGG